MKTNKIIGTLCALAMLGFGACSKFLEENPTTRFSAETIYANDAGAIAALDGLHACLAVYAYYGYHAQALLLCFSGLYGTNENVNVDYITSSQLNITSTHGATNSVFQNIYRTLNNATDILEKIGSAHAKGNISDGAYKRIIGEASFIRAFVYFDAVRMWGKIPLRTSTADGALPRAPIIDIYNYILNDLDVAEANMLTPVELKAQEIVGRPSKWAAIALRAKVYVAMACITEHPNEPFDNTDFSTDAINDYWTPAYENAKRVYDSQEFILIPLRDLWLDFYKRRNNAESLFEIQHSIASVTSNGAFWSQYIPTRYGGDWDGDPNTESTSFTGAAELVPGNNASRILMLRETFDRHVAAYTLSDPRFYHTYIFNSYYRNKNNLANELPNPHAQQGNIYPNNNNANSRANVNAFPHCKKFTDPITTSVSGSVNWPALRYADVLLTLAEAANEIGRPPSEVVGYVNEILQRARESATPVSVQPIDWSDSFSKEELREKIMNERLFELHGETHEFYDVRRRGLQRFKALIMNHNEKMRDPTISTYDAVTGRYTLLNYRDSFWAEDDYSIKKSMLLPIPANEMNNNPNIKKNNFGY